MCATAEARAAEAAWPAAREIVGAMDNEHQVVLTLLFEPSR
jgi:hypothetical protein